VVNERLIGTKDDGASKDRILIIFCDDDVNKL
jgi:hypothetical protein